MPKQESASKVRGWQWLKERVQGPYAIYWLAALTFVEPIFLPFWPESLMAPMILADSKRWKKYAIITTIFSVLGGIAGYFIGRAFFIWFGPQFLAYFGLRRSFHLARSMLSAAAFPVMLFVTFTPLPDKVFVISAGFLHVPFWQYATGFFLGRAFRFGFIAHLLHRYDTRVLSVVKKYFDILALIVALLLVYAVWRELHIINF